jgi:signal transduction histidine kinase
MLSNNESAEKLLLNSLKKATDLGNPILIMANYKNLKEYYEKKGDNSKALEYATKYQSLNDSTYKTGNADKILELQAKYETAEKEKQLANLTREKLEQKLKLQEANQTRNTLIGLSVFLLILSALIYSRFILKKRSQKQLSAINLKLNELNKTKDKLFSIVSHDLKNNVSAFTNITDVVNKNFDSISPQQLKYYVAEMANSANGMKSLFRNLLEWAKSQRNQIIVNPIDFSLAGLLSENIFQVQQQLNRRKITVLMDNSKDLHIRTDKDILTTVIRNLITNAIKYSHDEGKIEISFAADAGFAKISITDYGIGMDTSEINSILNSLTNISSKPDVEGEKGAGLGLMLCKELLLKISGKIDIASQKDQGSQFVITIPQSL